MRDNLTFRTIARFAMLYTPFEPLLVFASVGYGDQFAFARAAGRRTGSSIIQQTEAPR
ncbi:hypothetical protein [Dactylosporangium sp. NPDC051484]|uniref:hypothetical protein n=1 Tax=Dactylosporangium sp. NPDC051484 TaxID=3154942 RepID=UPI00344DE50E